MVVTRAPFKTIWPPALTPTVTVELADAAAPSTSATERLVAWPLATAPVVLALTVQGLTVTVWPRASGWPAAKVERVTTKMQEPKAAVPPALLPPELTSNPGAAAVPLNARVVVPVVPRAGTPDGNAKDVPANAPATVALAGMVASALATRMGSLLPPPPQAASRAAAATALKTSLMLEDFMDYPFWKMRYA